MSFRLWTIFYVFALVAAALATFGAWGIAVATAILTFWVLLLNSQKPGRVVEWLVIILIIGFLAELVRPATVSSRYRAIRAVCQNNLRQVAQSLHIYRSTNGTLPPAHVVDATGTPMLSWRVLLLPALDRGDLFQALDLSKVWNDPVNNSVCSGSIYVMQCPVHWSNNAMTNYFAIVGAQTAWLGDRGRPLSELDDRTDETIVLVESRNRKVHWAEPRDLSFDEAVDLLANPVPPEDGHWAERTFFYKERFGRNVAFADGSVAFLSAPLDRELAAALLTVAGGEKIDHAALDRATRPQLDYAKCYAFGLFMLLSLLPAAWVRRRRQPPRSGIVA